MNYKNESIIKMELNSYIISHVQNCELTISECEFCELYETKIKARGF